MERSCPALMISAPGSNHGKTTVTAALARHHASRGRKVRVFKAGPDFLDPMIHERASGQPAYQLDLWLAGEAECRRLVYEAAGEADLILIEGVMGLYDGEPCCADLARLLGVPVLAVIDARGVAQTFGALAYGLAHSRDSMPFAGVLANGIASPRHAEMVEQGIPSGMRYFGGLPRASDFALPERHLGLVPAAEVDNLEQRIDAAASAIGATGLVELPAPVAFARPEAETLPQLLQGVRIGIARDAAFSFIYPANLDVLRALGAELLFFSPLADAELPEVDSLYLPGGYPELHLQALQNNSAMKTMLRAHFEQGKPIYAECGGMLYLLETLTDKEGIRAEMAGLLPGHGFMQQRLQGLGYQSAPMPGGMLRAHTFHHSVVESPIAPFAVGERLFNTSPGERIFIEKRLVASYLHCYFPSNPAAVAELFRP